MAHAGGRPKKYKSADDMQVIIDSYFDSCYEDKTILDKDGNYVGTEKIMVRPLTITGLALALDMTRDMIIDYQDDAEFSNTIKKAKMKCHNFAEEQLFTNKSAAGVIFNLKNNYGWRDKTEQDITVSTGIAERLKRAKERKCGVVEE